MIQATTAAAGADVAGATAGEADGAVVGAVATTDAGVMEAITADGIIKNAKLSIGEQL